MGNSFYINLGNSILPPLCMNIKRLTWILFNFFTKSPDMYIYCTNISWIIISPYNIEQIFSAVYFIWMERKKLKQIIFLSRKFYFLIFYKYSSAVTVYLKPILLKYFFFSSSVALLELLRMMALILAFTSKILNGFVI